MKNLSILLLLLILLGSCKQNQYEISRHVDINGYSYEVVSNDPAALRIYTLNNGLKVYLSHNPAEPRIMGLIAVKAGSTSDPEETTGLAHYFEHIMFKGTSSFGTTDWEKEKPLLDSLSSLFELYRMETNEEKRAEIYSLIDELSIEASKYAIANEYDKMCSEMGATFTNAFTSYDVTAYMNNIPSNELRRWLALEYNRFGDVALRLFHTELETVYEEFNMYQDRDDSRAWEALYRGLFPKGPLGRSVIGLPEHLKNPSMVNIMDFKDTWYVPNNMAVILSGEFDMEEAILMIDETFGQMESKPLPERPVVAEDLITEPVEIDIFGPDAENIQLAWRLDGDKPGDEEMLYMMSQILYNRNAGLIDINLIQEQEVLDAYAYSSFFEGYGTLNFFVNPKNDQSLEEARDLILGEIEKLKAGDFPDWMPSAIANQHRISMLRRYQGQWRAFDFLNAFVNEKDWRQVISFADRLEKITKKQVMDYSSQFFGNNYVAIYKRTGEATDLVKVPKPPITPVEINREGQSRFYSEWQEIPRDTILPVFIDYDKDIQFSNISQGVEFSYVPNTTNEFFTHYYIIDAGKNHDLKTPLAFDYVSYIGTENRTATELKQELFRYGLSTFTFSGDDRSWIYISGLNRNLEKGLEIMEEIITQSKPDAEAYQKFAERAIKERNDTKLNLDNILWNGLYNRARYGAVSPFNDVLSNQELREIDPESLTNLLKQQFEHPHRIFYYGPSGFDEVKETVMKYHKIPDNPKPLPEPKEYPELEIQSNQVFLANYDMSQVNIILLGKGEAFSEDILIGSRMFNQYFGNSMSSIVFQEIREAQGLAYAAWMGYNAPSKKENSFYLMGYIGTQPDKLEMATTSFERLLNEIIENDQSFEISRNAIINSIASERIINERIFFQWLSNQDRGINRDYREDVYLAAQTASMDDLRAFFDNYVKPTPYAYLIIGDTKMIDKKMLNRLGKVTEYSTEELFGF